MIYGARSACNLRIAPQMRKVQRLFGGNSEKEQKVLSWLLSSKGKTVSSECFSNHVYTFATGISFSIFKYDARLCIFCQRLLNSIDRLQHELCSAVLKAESNVQQLYLARELKMFTVHSIVQPVINPNTYVHHQGTSHSSDSSGGIPRPSPPNTEGTVEAVPDRSSLLAEDKDSDPNDLGTPLAKVS